MRLNEISDNNNASKKRKRLGRGPGSGLGKTGGRGIKGQTSRSGVAIKGFEGGQMPIHMRMPKRGFNSRNKIVYHVISLIDIQNALSSGDIEPNIDVDYKVLQKAGLTSKKNQPLKILGSAKLSHAINFIDVVASKSAFESIESSGGKLTYSSVD